MMKRVKNVVCDLAVYSMPMWCMLLLVAHWFVFGY